MIAAAGSSEGVGIAADGFGEAAKGVFLATAQNTEGDGVKKTIAKAELESLVEKAKDGNDNALRELLQRKEVPKVAEVLGTLDASKFIEKTQSTDHVAVGWNLKRPGDLYEAGK